jgi:predicted DCC family thiol-disulfide oxidoreductase YuxK
MQQATMLYDGQCMLCQGSKRFIEYLDWRDRVEMLDAQDRSLVRERYPGLSYEALMGAVHVVTADGEVKSGFFAVRYLARFLPMLWPVLPFLYLPGMNWLGPKVYNWVARRRYKINRLAGRPVCEDGLCKIPGVE